MKSKVTVADFPESEVAINVAYYLAGISRRNRRFRIRSISPSKERCLGYDARMEFDTTDFVPFYMQFKRPTSYPQHSRSKIIKQRKRLKANTSEQSLAFKLLRKKQHHADYQHNILLNLSESELGHAGYVCPLFIDGDLYSRTMTRQYRLSDPYYYQSQHLSDDEVFYEIHDVPFIKSHVTIIPHAKVTDANHHYSFDMDGDDICFHEPQLLTNETRSIESFLDHPLSNFRAENTLNLERSDGSLEALVAKTVGEFEYAKIRPQIIESKIPEISKWGLWGNYLRTNYRIQQFFMMKS